MILGQELGMELPSEKLMIAQRWMIERANLAAKPVIVNIPMLSSMVKGQRCTRTEALDVSQAVSDGVDALVLGDETANGDNPLLALTTMSKICLEVENTLNYKNLFNETRLCTAVPVSTAESIAQAVCGAAHDQKSIHLIAVVSDTGKLGRTVAKYKPAVKVLVASPSEKVVTQLSVVRGVTASLVGAFSNTEQAVTLVCNMAKDTRLVSAGAKVAVMHANGEETPSEETVIKFVDV
jgi:pyruvate kinase